MIESKYKIVSLIVCDDIRTEVGGKQSAFGLYDGEMVASAFPVVLSKLCFRLAIYVPKGQPKKVRIVVSSANNSFFDFEGAIAKPALGASKGRYALSFVVSPAIIKEEGAYSIKLGVDGPPKKIGELIVRLPKGDAEKDKLAAVVM